MLAYVSLYLFYYNLKHICSYLYFFTTLYLLQYLSLALSLYLYLVCAFFIPLWLALVCCPAPLQESLNVFIPCPVELSLLSEILFPVPEESWLKHRSRVAPPLGMGCPVCTDRSRKGIHCHQNSTMGKRLAIMWVRIPILQMRNQSEPRSSLELALRC